MQRWCRPQGSTQATPSISSHRRFPSAPGAARAEKGPGPNDKGSPTGAFAPYEVKIDLREFESVRTFLKSKGISDESTADEVLQWAFPIVGIAANTKMATAGRRLEIAAKNAHVACPSPPPFFWPAPPVSIDAHATGSSS